MPHRPNLFLIGAPKSGTSSLYRYLDQHPDVFMSRPKEPGYFSPDVTGSRVEREFSHPEDEARYLALFDGSGGAVRRGEASTNYLMSRRAPSLIRELAPDARLIVMLRNPVELVHSLHGQRVANGTEPLTDFGEALQADDDRRAGRRLPRAVSGYGVAYRDNALLGEQLERWLSAWGRDAIHAIVFDDFAADTAAEFRSVLRFIGVDETFVPDEFDVYNSSYRPRRGPLRLLYANPVTRWLARTALPAAVGDAATKSLRRRLGTRRVTRSAVKRPPMSADLRARLQDEFAGDVALLGRLIDRDLTAQWFGSRADAAAA